MERLLLSVGTLVQHVISTEDGRKMIGELANSVLAWLAETAVAAAAPAPTAPVTRSKTAAASEPHVSRPAAATAPVPVAVPAAVAVAVPTREFPAKYTCIREMADKIHNDFAVIDSTHGPRRRVTAIYDFIWDIIQNKRGVLVYPKLKKSLLDRVDGILTEIQASADFNADEKHRFNYRFTDTHRVLNTMCFNSFTWYEADGSRSAAAYAPASGRFIEIRRGNLTGRALNTAGRREWASAAELVGYWQANNITTHSIAYENRK